MRRRRDALELDLAKLRETKRALPADESVVKTLTWSSLTTPGVFQAAVEASIIKRQGRTYGPPAGRTRPHPEVGVYWSSAREAPASLSRGRSV